MVRSIAWLITLPVTAFGQIKISPQWMDHMVIQRGKPVSISGKATPGATVQLSFSGKSVSARAAKDSSWQIRIGPLKANAYPSDMRVSAGKDTLILKDLLVGDVWLCLGQSNMEFPMRNEAHYAEARRNITRGPVRWYNPGYVGKGIYNQHFSGSLVQRIDNGVFYTGAWQRCDSASLADMSAVAYYFAEKVTASAGVPIGLVQLAIGGAPLETFVPKEALLADSAFARKVRGNWLYNPELPDWSRERGRQNRGDDASADGPAHGYKPGFAFDKGLRGLTGNPVAGILFYQGETNAQETARVAEYSRLFDAMLRAYRAHWPGVPCYFVQLSSIDSSGYRSKLWPQFRDEQRRILQFTPNTGMAVSSDVGARNNVHPANKRAVGYRLAAWALHYYYKLGNVVPSGPLVEKAEYRQGKIILHFKWAEGLAVAGGALLKGFSLDGTHPVPASIHGITVEIPSSGKPAFVYYGWQPFTDANLVNAAGLPASTFRIRIEP
ncbi:sialate O-acetylesterase [Chitinophaga rhizosphaerae]|uniref:sialate O-acetylesterase n=1 Tax=Chitinophaga rhizosphaerae TaxID=1864947 RepID=UPI0013DF823E|nr:sialate O-acetylesterase [Chitinophaga rhizosphaerae]